MLTRRALLGGTALTAGSLALPGCGSGEDSYEAVASETWAPLAADADTLDLVRYATLAANGHNTQPWRFALSDKGVAILPDLSRRTPVVDPDDHHLYVSLGCAAENLVLAAAARGRAAETRFEPDGEGRIVASLTPAPAVEDELFAAIPQRQCTRSEFDGSEIGAADLRRLSEAARVGGVELLILSDRPGIELLLDHAAAANAEQVGDTAFRDELKDWIRFNASDAVTARDGLYAPATGNPSLPAWIGQRLFDFVFTVGAENDRLTRQMRSSAAIAVFVGAGADRASWIDVGRAYQRFALQATALGIRQAFVNQPVEVAAVRPRLAAALGIDRRPDLVVRIGRAPLLPRSLRRPVDAVLA